MWQWHNQTTTIRKERTQEIDHLFIYDYSTYNERNKFKYLKCRSIGHTTQAFILISWKRRNSQEPKEQDRETQSTAGWGHRQQLCRNLNRKPSILRDGRELLTLVLPPKRARHPCSYHVFLCLSYFRVQPRIASDTHPWYPSCLHQPELQSLGWEPPWCSYWHRLSRLHWSPENQFRNLKFEQQLTDISSKRYLLDEP